MRKILSPAFFNRSTFSVARELLGKFLVRKWHGKEIAAMITEVEAYDGFRDRASHASHGMTARNKPMFGPAGRWYVYFTYGMHWMLNIVTGPVGYPAAILIRAVEFVPSDIRKSDFRISEDGPGKVTRRFHIGREFDGHAASRQTGLWIEDRGIIIPRTQIARLPRIGVDYAGKEWAEKKYRFLIND